MQQVFKYLFLHVLVLVFSVSKSDCQYKWQDPLNFESFEMVDKKALFYNLLGTFGSFLLDKDSAWKSQWQLSLYSDFQKEYEYEELSSQIVWLKLRLGYQLKNYLQFGGEWQMGHVDTPGNSTFGLGAAIYFNWYFINCQKLRFYFDNGFGILMTNNNFPESGTKFNFSTFYGLSVDFLQGLQNGFKLGIRNIHISNAFIFGDDRNPSFDSIGIHFGLVHKFMN